MKRSPEGQGFSFEGFSVDRLKREAFDALANSGANLGVILNTCRRKPFLVWANMTVMLSMLLGACGVSGVTQEAPTPGDSNDPRPTESINVGPTAESISHEDPFVPYGAGGELSEIQVNFLESERGRALVRAYGQAGDKWIGDGVFGPDTTLSLVPVEDHAEPGNIDKMFVVAIVNAPGDNSYDGFFVTLPAGMVDLYLHGDADKGIEPGDINQLKMPEGKVLEPFRMSRVVGEGSIPAQAGIPIGSVLQFVDQEFVYRFGSANNLTTVGRLNESYQWTSVEDIASQETGTEFANPFGVEEAKLIESAGYLFDGKTGTLTKDRVVVARYDGSSWVDQNGVEVNLNINLTNGVDYDGNDIHAILTREVDEQTEMYNFIAKEWQVPLDIAASMEAVSKNNIEKDLSNWKTRVEIDFNDVHEISWDDFKSGRLFLSYQLNPQPLPENPNILPLKITMSAIIQNHWTLDDFFANNIDWYGTRADGKGENYPNTDRPLVYENDPTRVVSVHKMKSPLTGDWLTVTGERHHVDGRDVILYLFTGGKTTIPNAKGGAYSAMEDVWSFPPSQILLPVLSAKKGDSCGLGAAYASQDVCDLVGYGGTPAPRDLVPPELRAIMAEWDRKDGELLTTYSDVVYPFKGKWIFGLQRVVIPANIESHNGLYFNLESSEDLNGMWPD